MGPLVLTFFIVIFLLLMQFLWKYIDDLAGKGLGAGVIAELLIYTSTSLVPMALPLAILLASLMTFGNLGENYELLALKAAGISLQRIMFPLIMFIILVGISAFFFSNNVMPYSNLKMRALLYDIQQKRPEFNIREGIFYYGIDNYSIKIADKDPRTNLLRDIKIYDHTDGAGNVAVTVADSGYMRMTTDSNLLVTLYNSYTYNELQRDKRQRREKRFPHRRDYFEKQDIILELSGFAFSRTDEDLFKSGFQMMNLKQLEAVIDSLEKDLHQTKNRFYRELVISHYLKHDFVQRRWIVNDSVEVDRKLFRVLNTDSLYKTLNTREKENILSSALNNARSAASFISAQKNNIYNKTKRIRRHEIEWHRKFTLSFACFIFFFIGAPLGAIIRKGGLGMPVVVSVLFFVLYYVISISGEKFVREDMVQPYEGMWLSSVILLPLGVFLTYKATTDSVILNIDMYISFIKKIFFIEYLKNLPNKLARIKS